MARKASKRAKAKKTTKKRGAKRATARSAKSANAKSARKTRRTVKTRRTARTAKPERAAPTSQRKQQEPIPADPAGRIGLRRPSNEPKTRETDEARELGHAEPDARLDDPREPEQDARERPGGGVPPAERRAGYRNTDEGD